MDTGDSFRVCCRIWFMD